MSRLIIILVALLLSSCGLKNNESIRTYELYNLGRVQAVTDCRHTGRDDITCMVTMPKTILQLSLNTFNARYIKAGDTIVYAFYTTNEYIHQYQCLNMDTSKYYYTTQDCDWINRAALNDRSADVYLALLNTRLIGQPMALPSNVTSFR